MKHLFKLFATLAIALILAGCARTKAIPDIHSTVKYGEHTAVQVHDAIMNAGKQRKWVMRDSAPGVIAATTNARGHMAEVRIPYTATQYSIEYVTSQNMRAHDGHIHRNYIRWIHKLNQQIQINLANNAGK